MQITQKIRPRRWLDGQAEEAAACYAGTFRNSRAFLAVAGDPADAP